VAIIIIQLSSQPTVQYTLRKNYDTYYKKIRLSSWTKRIIWVAKYPADYYAKIQKKLSKEQRKIRL